MNHRPIFGCSSYRAPPVYPQTQTDLNSFDSHFITPPKPSQTHAFNSLSTGKPPLNSKCIPLETAATRSQLTSSYGDTEKVDRMSPYCERDKGPNCSFEKSYERKPIFDQNKGHVKFVNQVNPQSAGQRKSSWTLNSKNEGTFILNCPDCHKFINLLDSKSSKNQALEEYLKDLLKNVIPVKKENSESFISTNGLFEGKDAQIEQKYGKYLKSSGGKNSVMESPLASRNIVFSNKKKLSTTLNTFDFYCGENVDDSYLSLDQQKATYKEKNGQKAKGEDLKLIGELKGEIRNKDAEIKRLSEMNRKLMEDMNSLLKIRIL